MDTVEEVIKEQKIKKMITTDYYLDGKLIKSITEIEYEN